MADRRRIFPTVIAAALIALCLPLLASAQSNYDPWDYGQNRDHRSDRDGSDRYNRERLRDSVRRVRKQSREFEKHLDSSLDYSRYNDGRFEDHVNKEAGEFRQAALDGPTGGVELKATALAAATLLTSIRGKNGVA